jgi:hypothetical protein
MWVFYQTCQKGIQRLAVGFQKGTHLSEVMQNSHYVLHIKETHLSTV